MHDSVSHIFPPVLPHLITTTPIFAPFSLFLLILFLLPLHHWHVLLHPLALSLSFTIQSVLFSAAYQCTDLLINITMSRNQPWPIDWVFIYCLSMPSTRLLSGIKIHFGNRHRNARQSVTVMLKKSSAQLHKKLLSAGLEDMILRLESLMQKF